MDSVWLVKVPKSVQIQRAMMRDGATEEAVTARINAQMSLADKEKFADVVIDNSGTLDSTKAQVTAQLQNVLGAV
jgi:dephospho-CoA kinase